MSELIKLDFTTTACCRPDILRQTYRSFREHLKGVDWPNSELHLHVDRVPVLPHPLKVLEAAGEFFKPDGITAYFGKTPCFPAAVKWCWMQPRGTFFFHLEDDWELRHDIDVRELFSILEDRPDLACVNLRAYDFGNVNDTRICLSPALWRTACAKVISSRMDTDFNPELQLRPITHANPAGGKQGSYKAVQFPANERVIFDIGRNWLAKSGWRKDCGDLFVKWEEAMEVPNV